MMAKTANVYKVEMVCVMDGDDELSGLECVNVLAENGESAVARVRHSLMKTVVPWTDDDGEKHLARYTSCELVSLNRLATDVLIATDSGCECVELDLDA